MPTQCQPQRSLDEAPRHVRGPHVPASPSQPALASPHLCARFAAPNRRPRSRADITRAPRDPIAALYFITRTKPASARTVAPALARTRATGWFHLLGGGKAPKAAFARARGKPSRGHPARRTCPTLRRPRSQRRSDHSVAAPTPGLQRSAAAVAVEATAAGKLPRPWL
eukprot:360565-Chlamydomonas_euryale.AAC.5